MTLPNDELLHSQKGMNTSLLDLGKTGSHTLTERLVIVFCYDTYIYLISQITPGSNDRLTPTPGPRKPIEEISQCVGKLV